MIECEQCAQLKELLRDCSRNYIATLNFNELKKRAVMIALLKTETQAQAAKLLGISQSYVSQLVKKYNVELGDYDG